MLMGLQLRVPAQVQPGQVLKLDLVLRGEQGLRILGGLAVEMRVH